MGEQARGIQMQMRSRVMQAPGKKTERKASPFQKAKPKKVGHRRGGIASQR
jgi:hypothetical protein